MSRLERPEKRKKYKRQHQRKGPVRQKQYLKNKKAERDIKDVPPERNGIND